VVSSSALTRQQEAKAMYIKSFAVLLLTVSLTGCFCVPIQAPAIIEPLDTGLGYTIEGSYNFEGVLFKENESDPKWKLEGSFVFNTGGYTVAEPEVVVMESFPEQVAITLTVTPPPFGAIVTQALTEVAVSAEIYASNEADFTVKIQTDCPSLR